MEFDTIVGIVWNLNYPIIISFNKIFKVEEHI